MTLDDVEKAPDAHLSGAGLVDADGTTNQAKAPANVDQPSWLEKLERRAGLEARGIQRVELHERHSLTRSSYAQIALLWISINLCANNVALGLLGPSIFALSFRDSALCAVFGALLGSIPTAYIATWGPISGNRTMVCITGVPLSLAAALSD